MLPLPFRSVKGKVFPAGLRALYGVSPSQAPRLLCPAVPLESLLIYNVTCLFAFSSLLVGFSGNPLLLLYIDTISTSYPMCMDIATLLFIFLKYILPACHSPYHAGRL